MSALATVVMVAGRLAAGADLPTLAESVAAVSSSRGPYALSGAGRIVSGITLFAGAWYLSRTRIVRRSSGAPGVPVLLALSGAFTAASGALAIALATLASQVAISGVLSRLYRLAGVISDLRGLTGRIGFALAGLALVLVSRHLWRVGEGRLGYTAPLTAAIGIAMQFIWIDSVTIVHRIVGAAFFVWLVAAGALLRTGRIGRRPAEQPPVLRQG